MISNSLSSRLIIACTLQNMFRHAYFFFNCKCSLKTDAKHVNLCWTRLRMFTRTCSHPSRSCHALQSLSRFWIPPAVSSFQIKIKEALYIKWENPTLSQQIKQLDLSNSFYFFFFLFVLVLVFAVGGFDFVAPKLLFTIAVFCFRCISKIQILRGNFITKLYSEIPNCTTNICN